MAGITGLGQSQLYDGQQLDRAADKLMSRKDADGNGTLSAEELGGPDGSFEKVDTNADGQVDKTEIIANKPRPLFNRIAAQAIRKLDTDGDGALGADELDGSAERFDRIDKNQDGEIDKKELGGLLQHHAEKAELSQSVDPHTTDPLQVTPSQTQINIYNQINVFREALNSEDEPDIESSSV